MYTLVRETSKGTIALLDNGGTPLFEVPFSEPEGDTLMIVRSKGGFYLSDPMGINPEIERWNPIQPGALVVKGFEHVPEMMLEDLITRTDVIYGADFNELPIPVVGYAAAAQSNR